jgi:hypothetical protein
MKKSTMLEYLVLIPAAVALIGIAERSYLSKPTKSDEEKARAYVEALPVKQDTLYGPSLDELIFKNLPNTDSNILFAARDRILELNPKNFPRGRKSLVYNGEIFNVPYDSTMVDEHN